MIVSTGLCVPACLEAAEVLEQDGISAQVINIHTIKPIDETLLLREVKRCGKVITVEEHSVIGGLGSAEKVWLRCRRHQEGYSHLVEIGLIG